MWQDFCFLCFLKEGKRSSRTSLVLSSLLHAPAVVKLKKIPDLWEKCLCCSLQLQVEGREENPGAGGLDVHPEPSVTVGHHIPPWRAAPGTEGTSPCIPEPRDTRTGISWGPRQGEGEKATQDNWLYREHWWKLLPIAGVRKLFVWLSLCKVKTKKKTQEAEK